MPFSHEVSVNGIGASGLPEPTPTARDAQILRNMRAELDRVGEKIDGMRGAGVVNTARSIVINAAPPPPPRRGTSTPSENFGVIITRNCVGGGKYFVRHERAIEGTFTTSTDLDLSTMFDTDSDETEFVLQNDAEDKTSTHYLAIGQRINCRWTAIQMDGLRVASCNVGITDIRHDTTAQEIQVAFTNSREEADWAPKVDTELCEE